jgi:transposase-like protein
MHSFPSNLLEATRYFADEQRCIDVISSLRRPDGVIVCPFCGAAEKERKHYWLATQKRWKCFGCRKQFSVKIDTIFEDSPIKLDKWLLAFWMLCNCKNGISSYEISRDLKVTQKTAWFMLQRLRFALRSGSILRMGQSGGPVEADEAYIGGAPKNKHLSERRKNQRIVLDENNEWVSRKNVTGRGTRKTPVMGMIDRETRQVRAQVLPHMDRKILQTMILDNVAKGSKVFTDGLTGYANLTLQGFVHETVNHIDEYVRGEVHTNSIENFWSLLERGLNGTYVAVEPFHLDRYITEQVFRFNNRATKDNPVNDGDRFALALSQIAGKRLTWAELTGKVPPSA